MVRLMGRILSTYSPRKIRMPHDELRIPPRDSLFSRRGFLGATSAAAGAVAAGRWLLTQTPAVAAGKKDLPPAHALDPLSASEIEQAIAVLGTEKRLGDAWRYVTVTLSEPTRPEVAAYRPGQKFSRCAQALLIDTDTCKSYEALVDLAQGKCLQFDPLAAGLQPPIMIDEFVECEAAVKRSAEFRAALAKRGVNDVKLVMVDPWSAGMYGNELPEDQGKRLSRALVLGPLRADRQRLRPAAGRRDRGVST